MMWLRLQPSVTWLGRESAAVLSVRWTLDTRVMTKVMRRLQAKEMSFLQSPLEIG